MISIPSIFYGTTIKKGSVNLKFYMTGTLMAQASDTGYNGRINFKFPELQPGALLEQFYIQKGSFF